MRSLHFVVLSFLLLSLSANACETFLYQQCIDVPHGFNPTSSIKCIQLVPKDFDPFIEYSLKTYLVLKASTCSNIQLYESSTIAFANECREQCSEQYCLLFDSQSNASSSIINIFLLNSFTQLPSNTIYYLNGSSIDYPPFDTCSTVNRTNTILLIVVIVLSCIVVLITILVISRIVLSKYLEKKQIVPEYNIKWVYDFLRGQTEPIIRRTDVGESEDNLMRTGNHFNLNDRGMNTPRLRQPLGITPSAVSYPLPGSNSNTGQGRSYPINNSSEGSSGQDHHGSFSMTNNRAGLQGIDTAYVVMHPEADDEDSIFDPPSTTNTAVTARNALSTINSFGSTDIIRL